VTPQRSPVRPDSDHSAVIGLGREGKELETEVGRETQPEVKKDIDTNGNRSRDRNDKIKQKRRGTVRQLANQVTRRN
jgi:hypothetical protein